jgi:hypothetical protein
MTMKNPIKKLFAVVTFVGAASTSAIAAPRTLANGAPAPGNTVAKGGSSADYKSPVERAERSLALAKRELTAALTEEREAINVLAAQPRSLPNGAPACGNTGGKAPKCTAEMADELFKQRMTQITNASASVMKARVRVHEATRTFATLSKTATPDDDYS